MVDEERERKLVITNCPREAEGRFTAKTNQDETECKLRVVPVNEFLKVRKDNIVLSDIPIISSSVPTLTSYDLSRIEAEITE